MLFTERAQTNHVDAWRAVSRYRLNPVCTSKYAGNLLAFLERTHANKKALEALRSRARTVCLNCTPTLEDRRSLHRVGTRNRTL